jgi:MYXO-CTERM domain-containing protein
MRQVLSVAALLALAGAANAAITGVIWREVSNAASPYPPNAAPGADPTPGGAAWNAGGPWRTFDLYVVGLAGDIINGIEAGGGSDTTFGIRTSGQPVFNHPSGGDARTQAFEAFFSSLPFDTFATFGGNATTAGQSASFAGVTDLTGTNQVSGVNRLRFTSFTQPPIALNADAAVGPGGGSLWVLRVTIKSTVTNLGGTVGGQLSVVQVGLPGGAVANFNAPNAVPTPGALALLGLGGLAVARRKR